MEEKLKELISFWNIGEVLSFKKIKKGVVNTNWIVKTSKGKFILRKVNKEKKFSELKFELEYLDYLRNKKFPYSIPAPIKNKQGNFFIQKEDSFFWIYEFIEGRDIKRFGYSELRECAKMMAFYHKLIKKSNLNNKKGLGDVFNRKPVLNELQEFYGDILKSSIHGKKEKIFLKEASVLIPLLKNLEEKDYSKIPKYPLHRDINPENTLWKNKKLVGVIDFENVATQNDTAIKDIAGMLQYSCRDKEYRHKLDLKLAKFFIKEYKKYHSLSKKEIEFLPDVVTAGAIEDFSYSYWMLLNDSERAKLYRLSLYSNVAQWFHRNKEEIVRKIQ